MPASRLIALYLAAACVMILAVLLAVIFAERRVMVDVPVAVAEQDEEGGDNRLGNSPEMVDRLERFDTAEAFASGERKDVAVRSDDGQARLVLATEKPEYPRRGTWMSAEVVTAFPFTELLPSWNLVAPAETGALLEVRTRDAANGEWSPWYYLGQWGQAAPRRSVLATDGGEVQVDVLVLRRPADAYQVRVALLSYSTEESATPAVRRVSVSYSGAVRDSARREQLAERTSAAPGGEVDLKLPFRAQRDEPDPFGGQICSPTSVTMVMAHYGVDRPTMENALAIFDRENGIFGNWGRAIAHASQLGFDGHLTRFRNWDQVKATLAAGQPLIASIRFTRAEVPDSSFVYKSTGGHLVVIRGMTAEGDVILNDPASRDKGNGVVVKADHMAKAWFDKGGVAYVIYPGGDRARQQQADADRP